ncbi:uncharacterized protein GIQ15_04206 [Arthroderma uncinatum]|uniref:uncharacterized protein n=1 Tax=Arthroderma uncinatum TaxID=74035 RepID=UPI00144A94CD|nr:uncharacterized protein GIQ15_04206 [Arthroderma uncinatum]KAF3481447.1 hypothetical protein GIQ15_04206 [Arthroderma uncinatum]
MPETTGCVICGYEIEDDGKWLGEFRTLYSSAEGAFITGVGLYPKHRWNAPLDYDKRWDDPDYSRSDATSVKRRSNKFLDDEVPPERLFSICRSLPFPMRAESACWGHDYGGLTFLDTKTRYPWEDITLSGYDVSKKYAKKDPYNVAEISGLLLLSSEPSRTSSTTETMPMAERTDCFSKFPWEITEVICINLRVQDILSLVQASSAFRPILTSQIFWASRFKPGNEWDFIFEGRNWQEPRDWIKLYQLTSRSLLPDGLKNRKRIWDLIRLFAESLSVRLDPSQEFSVLELGTRDEWREATADILPDITSHRRTAFMKGCDLFHKQRAMIPSGLLRIAFSITANTITGLRLIADNHEDICLGYVKEEDQLVLEVTVVCGFILAIGSRGVHAIRVIDRTGRTSRWIGNPNDTPITERLTGFQAITALEVGVDGYKVVSIAAAGPRRKICDSSLRTVGLWYPTVPNWGLHLNEETFTAKRLLGSGYWPLIWIHFGGPGGIYLQYLTAICVTWTGMISCIEFEYEADADVPTEVRKLGRHKITEVSRITRFQINGRAGECIDTISASTGARIDGKLKKSEYMTAFEITTNSGRSALFKPPSSTAEFILEPLPVAPGATPTGLYTSVELYRGLSNLGAISEVVKPNKRKRREELESDYIDM